MPAVSRAEAAADGVPGTVPGARPDPCPDSGEGPGPPPVPDVRPDAARGVLNASGYLFVPLDGLPGLRDRLEVGLARAGVRGTVLLAPEGINVALAGTDAAVALARDALAADPRLAPLRLGTSRSSEAPFERLKVRLRDEIIAFDGAGRSADRGAGAPAATRAPAVAPDELARWLDGARPEVRLLDARNRFEIEAGGFEDALSLEIDRFRDFRAAVDAALADGTLDPTVPLVTYCTGGVRCEKAAPWLLERGFEEVWQLDGGILGWLARRGGERWRGDCFVFDGRVSLDARLHPTGATLCPRCGGAVAPGGSCRCDG